MAALPSQAPAPAPVPTGPVVIDVDIHLQSRLNGSYRGVLPGAWPAAPGGGQRVSSIDPLFTRRPGQWWDREGNPGVNSLFVVVDNQCDVHLDPMNPAFPPWEYPTIDSGGSSVSFTIVSAPDPQALDFWVARPPYPSFLCALYGSGKALANLRWVWYPLFEAAPAFKVGDVLTVTFDRNSLIRAQLLINGVSHTVHSDDESNSPPGYGQVNGSTAPYIVLAYAPGTAGEGL